MGNDIIPARRARAVTWIAAITTCFVVAGAGMSAAAIRYDAESSKVVKKGLVIGGIQLGGLPISVARQRIHEELEAPLDRPITVDAAGQLTSFTPRELGARSNALDLFDKATAQPNGANLLTRVWNRLATSYNLSSGVEVTYDRSKLDALVEHLAQQVNRPATDATIVYQGELKIVEEKAGFELDREAARDLLGSVISTKDVKVILPGKTTRAAVTKDQIGDVILVKVGENQLYHYRGSQLLKVYPVATGLPRYPTPKGQFKIVNKRYRPTWVNPAKYPGGWGANLPARIGPGPGNPLGTRALDLNSPGIRIHGTSANYSLGYNASHGCIRMSIKDSEELFDRVAVGTPVLIVQTSPNRPLGSRRARGPEDLAEADGTRVPGQPPPPPPPPPSQPEQAQAPAG